MTKRRTCLANVLLGKVTPGGKLTATWARRYEDYPCAEEYSYLNGKLEREEYKEGIYTGYRYFDTFGVKPLFPFGYGLSYTEMQIRFHGMKTSGDGVEVEAEVTNTGETFSGKRSCRSMCLFHRMNQEGIPSTGWLCKNKTSEAGEKNC